MFWSSTTRPPAAGGPPGWETFQQIVAGEQRPTVVARAGLKVGGTVAVAWDGGKEASRAMRTALPLLQRAERVIVLGAPSASSRKFDLAMAADFLAAREVRCEVEKRCPTAVTPPPRPCSRRPGRPRRFCSSSALSGHPRLREFIFGGATRTFLAADAPSLFLSH